MLQSLVWASSRTLSRSSARASRTGQRRLASSTSAPTPGDGVCLRNIRTQVSNADIQALLEKRVGKSNIRQIFFPTQRKANFYVVAKLASETHAQELVDAAAKGTGLQLGGEQISVEFAHNKTVESAPGVGRSVLVARLPSNVTQEELRSLFEPYGKLYEVYIARSPEGVPRFGRIAAVDAQTAAAIVAQHAREPFVLGGETLDVKAMDVVIRNPSRTLKYDYLKEGSLPLLLQMLGKEGFAPTHMNTLTPRPPYISGLLHFDSIETATEVRDFFDGTIVDDVPLEVRFAYSMRAKPGVRTVKYE